MTTRISYTVTATLPDEPTAASYIRCWLEEGHVDAVIEGGASSAMIIRLDQSSENDPIKIETRYDFPTRGAYDSYVEHTAPALRKDGVKRFGPVEGASFERRLGVIR